MSNCQWVLIQKKKKRKTWQNVHNPPQNLLLRTLVQTGIYRGAITWQSDVKLEIPLPREHLTEEGLGQAWEGYWWRAPSPLRMTAGATGSIKIPAPSPGPEPAKEKLWTNTKVQNARNGGRRISTSVFGKLEIRILNQKLAPCFHSTELSVRTSQGQGWGRQSGLKGRARGRPQPLRRYPWAASSVLMNGEPP